jgi:soluble lytic murein transglycosylase
MNERTNNTRLLYTLLASALLLSVQQTGTVVPGSQQGFSTADMPGGVTLSPTLHPVVPETLEAMWYAPAGASRATAPLVDLAQGVRLLEETGDAASALPLVSTSALQSTDVAPYARFYTGKALQGLNRLDEAEAAFASVAALDLAGSLPEAAALRQADVREARGNYVGAEAIYEGLVQQKVVAAQAVWLKLGLMAEMNGRRDRARDAFRYVIDTFPMTQEANEAELGLERIAGFALDTADGVAKEVRRADALFKARRNTPARKAYERVQGRVEGDNRDLVAIRLAALDAQEGRARAARDVLQRYAGHSRHGTEAQFALLGVTRDLGDTSGYRLMARSFVDANAANPLAEEALNDLGTHLVRADEDARAAEVFREMVERYPAGKFAERAAWKAGWWAYRTDNYGDTVRIFERGAASFPRSDYRPAWLYWSARAYDGLGNRAAATERYRLAATDYLNTYYGRLAWNRLEERNEASVTPGVRRAIVPPPPPPPTVDRIARLIELELYHPALGELQHAQKVYGDSAPLQATIAYVQHKLGNLRLGINAMKRAYPQYMAAGGEHLPREILQVIFPLDYWPMIQTLARQHDLDPSLVAALMAQESTFDAGILSSANAIGLMQVMPATGRRYAKKIGIAPFSPARLTDAEINARIGTRYLSELIRMFEGKAHYAIASYNAGENRVMRWRDERPGLEQEEFIDDIPYPETQNYVKRILGSAEDYRRLYGEGQTPPAINRSAPGKSLAGLTSTNGAGAKATAKEPTKKKPTKKTSAKKSSAKKSSAKKSSAKKSTAKKTTPKKTPKKKVVPKSRR